MKKEEITKALASAGYREKYAMENGTVRKHTQNGETLYTFTYSSRAQYQDANGATWNATRGAWTN